MHVAGWERKCLTYSVTSLVVRRAWHVIDRQGMPQSQDPLYDCAQLYLNFLSRQEADRMITTRMALLLDYSRYPLSAKHTRLGTLRVGLEGLPPRSLCTRSHATW